MKATSTVIVPFFFRESIENRRAKKQSKLIDAYLSKQIEPSPVTLMRHWAHRTYSKVKIYPGKPLQSTIDLFEETPACVSWRSKILTLGAQSRNKKNPLDVDALIEGMMREFSLLLNSSLEEKDHPSLLSYARYLLSRELLGWRSLWPQLEQISFDEKGISVESARKIIKTVKSTINKEVIELKDRDEESCMFIGLGSSSNVSGLSSSMKHM